MCVSVLVRRQVMGGVVARISYCSYSPLSSPLKTLSVYNMTSPAERQDERERGTTRTESGDEM